MTPKDIKKVKSKDGQQFNYRFTDAEDKMDFVNTIKELKCRNMAEGFRSLRQFYERNKTDQK
jgi:hypothetical protein